MRIHQACRNSVHCYSKEKHRMKPDAWIVYFSLFVQANISLDEKRFFHLFLGSLLIENKKCVIFSSFWYFLHPFWNFSIVFFSFIFLCCFGASEHEIESLRLHWKFWMNGTPCGCMHLLLVNASFVKSLINWRRCIWQVRQFRCPTTNYFAR